MADPMALESTTRPSPTLSYCTSWLKAGSQTTLNWCYGMNSHDATSLQVT